MYDIAIIGAALTPRDRTMEKFKLLKEKLRDYGFHWGKTVWREGAFLLRPQAIRQVPTGTKGVVLLGEAAGWISPSSAEGLSYAFHSAQLLAEVLHAGPENLERRYHGATTPLWRNIFLKSLKSRVVFHPTLRRIIMTLGLQSMEVYEPGESSSRGGVTRHEAAIGGKGRQSSGVHATPAAGRGRRFHRSLFGV